MGDLPELGKTTNELDKPPEKPATSSVFPQKQKITEPNPVSIIAPRVSTGYSITNYDAYIADIKRIEDLLKELKAILEKEDNPRNKLQLLRAKTYVFNLHVVKLKEKYQNSPEKHYETYKQLVYLDNYITSAKKLNAENMLKPINTVIDILEDSQDQGL